MNLPFSKMHGLGNDFVVIDARAQAWNLSADQMRAIANRRTGIGCDQILFLEPARDPRALARYRIFNADGSAAEHCGNGIRCIARFLELHGESGRHVDVEVGDEVYRLTFTDDSEVRVDMGCARFAPAAIPLTYPMVQPRYEANIAGQALGFGAVSIGNPHATLEVDDVDVAPVTTIGPALQASGLFPAGVNVGFMQIESPNSIRLRVFERGAGETSACGTGACAAVVIGRRWSRLEARVEVILSGGRLTIEWAGGDQDRIWMTGPATAVFEGNIEL